MSQKINKFNGQALQDKFVYNILKGKESGYFLELGSNHPIKTNNTYIFENELNWKGIMIEYDKKFLPLYKKKRPNSLHIIANAEKLNYDKVLEICEAPSYIDYLQIDLEMKNKSTLNTMIKFDKEIMDNYKFAVVTFEHDFYKDPLKLGLKTRDISRDIFLKRGYKPVFYNVCDNKKPYEDWYVHPDLVDMDHVNKIINMNKDNYKRHKLGIESIEFCNIIYPTN